MRLLKMLPGIVCIFAGACVAGPARVAAQVPATTLASRLGIVRLKQAVPTGLPAPHLHAARLPQHPAIPHNGPAAPLWLLLPLLVAVVRTHPNSGVGRLPSDEDPSDGHHGEPPTARATRAERYLEALVLVQRELLAAPRDRPVYARVVEPLGRASGADRSYVFEVHADESGLPLMSQKAEWCAPGVEPQIDNPLLQNVPYDDSMQRLFRLEVINAKVADLPERVRAILEPQAILAILIIPMVVHGELWGFIGFDNCTEAREWDPADVRLLQSAAAAISLAEERRRAEDDLRNAYRSAELLVRQRTAELERVNAELQARAAERQRAEDALARSERRFRALTEHSTDVVVITDAKGVIRYVSPSLTSVTGCRPQTVVGRSVFELIHSDDTSKVADAIRDLADGPMRSRQMELRVRRVDGAWAVLDASGRNLLGDPAVQGIVIHCRDVTRRKKIEGEKQHLAREVARSQAFFSAAVSVARVGIIVVDSSGRVTLANDMAAKMLGANPRGRSAWELSSLGFTMVRTDGCAEDLGGPLMRCLSSGTSLETKEWVIVRSDGTYIAALASVACVRDPAGNVEGAILSMLDVTQQKEREQQAAQALAKAEQGDQLLRALMEFAPEGILIADAPDGKTRMVSRAGAAMLGCKPEELVGVRLGLPRPLASLHYPDGRKVPEEDHPLTRAIGCGATVQGEEYLLRALDGTETVISCNAGPIRSADGSVAGGALVFRDVTALKRAREELRHALEKEKHISGILQQALIPPLPKPLALSGLEVIGRYCPAGLNAAVGGDFYDVFPLGDGRYGLVIGDVAGKGVDAAAKTALARFSVRAYARMGLPPGDVLGHVNRTFWEEYSDGFHFVTVFYGELDTLTGRLRYANAGHEPPLVLSTGRELIQLPTTGPTLGSFGDARFETADATVPPDGRVLLYTDGLSDAHTIGGSIMGIGPLVELAVGCDVATALDNMLEAARQHSGGELLDDAAVLLVRRLEAQP